MAEETANVNDGPFNEGDFKKDGGLKKAAVDRVEDQAPVRGTARSFNEVTDETTVTTVLDGQTVTFVEEGDTSDKSDMREPERATDPAVKAQDRAQGEGE